MLLVIRVIASRWWSPDFVIKQFDYFAEQGVTNIKIADELFVLNPNHFLAICKLIIERGYSFTIWAYSRVDTCKPVYLRHVEKAGVNCWGWVLRINNENRKVIHKGVQGGKCFESLMSSGRLQQCR